MNTTNAMMNMNFSTQSCNTSSTITPIMRRVSSISLSSPPSSPYSTIATTASSDMPPMSPEVDATLPPVRQLFHSPPNPKKRMRLWKQQGGCECVSFLSSVLDSHQKLMVPDLEDVDIDDSVSMLAPGGSTMASTPTYDDHMFGLPRSISLKMRPSPAASHKRIARQLFL
mmetsp:Transcript_12422/g.34236  ORF Transcript_12422/g.34236 Transcript_12422/m.34236 type:complete len:170 (-) Transcript_12422:205-714(-)|eukprot:CAMPEP_0198121102 /NCGR_PEP_ID=MMETSP1442-20131203/31194_1 /TAXON_ID= /ORGANISM="Craspedostauros australis, Strain CCMP3328" /LENGTH=169 /DNA_ID=CAMNT_0043779863 /DNA_START=173 /DNA_END=682 /DNA_ORIENTATION=-